MSWLNKHISRKDVYRTQQSISVVDPIALVALTNIKHFELFKRLMYCDTTMIGITLNMEI